MANGRGHIVSPLVCGIGRVSVQNCFIVPEKHEPLNGTWTLLKVQTKSIFVKLCFTGAEYSTP